MQQLMNSCQRSVWLAHTLSDDAARMYCAEAITFPTGVPVDEVRRQVVAATAMCPNLLGTYRERDGRLVWEYPTPQADGAAGAGDADADADEAVATGTDASSSSADAAVNPDADLTIRVSVRTTSAATLDDARALAVEFSRHRPTHPAVLSGADVCAHLLIDTPEGVVWVIRAHHIAVDGFFMFSFSAWVARRVGAALAGRPLPPCPFQQLPAEGGVADPTPVTAAEPGAEAVGRADVRENLSSLVDYWCQVGADGATVPRLLPEELSTPSDQLTTQPTAAAPDVPGAPSGSPEWSGVCTVRVERCLGAGAGGRLREFARAVGVSEVAVLAWLVADYTRALTLHSGPVVVGVPHMNRPLGKRPAPVPEVTVMPVPVVEAPLSVAAVRGVDGGLRVAGAVSGTPVEDLRAVLPRVQESGALCGPGVNYRPFPGRVPVPQGVVRIDTLCIGPIDDVEVMVFPDPGGQMAVAVLAQCDVGCESAVREVLDGHARRLVGMLGWVLGDGAAALGASDGAEVVVPVADEDDLAHIAATVGVGDVPDTARMTLPQLYQRQRQLCPADQPQLFWEGCWVDRAGFDRLVDEFVAVFARAGVSAGQRVALHVRRGPALLCAVTAAAACGVVWVPVDPELPAARRAHMAKAAEPVLWVCAAGDGVCPGSVLPAGQCAELVGVVDEHSDARVVCVDEASLDVFGPGLANADGDEATADGDEAPSAVADSVAASAQLRAHACAHVAGSDEAYVLFTSGSTGLPKAVSCTQEGLANRLAWQADMLNLTAEDVLVHKTAATFDVSVWELTYPGLYGLPTAVAPPDAQRDPALLAAICRAAGVSVCHFVPSALAGALTVWGMDPATVPKGLRVIVTSGEALPRHLVAGVHELLGEAVRVANFYGPTEATIDVTATWVDPHGQGDVPIGQSVWRTSTLIVDDAGRLVPPGGLGRLLLGGVQVARGYLGDEEKTAAAFLNDPLVHRPEWAPSRMYDSGDLARLSHSGLLYEGRRDGQVKLRGQRLELGDVTAAAVSCDEVLTATSLIREQAGEQYLCTYIVPAGTTSAGAGAGAGAGEDATAGAGAGAADSSALCERVRTHMAATLPTYMVPTIIDTLPHLPITSAGKLDRTKLPPLNPTPGTTTTAANATTPMEAVIAAHMGEHAHTTPLGAEDNFFAHGGTSLSAITLAHSLSTTLNQPVAVADIFAHPTPHALANHLTHGGDPWDTAAAETLTLATGNQSTRPIICLYPAGGLGWAYTGLIHHLPHTPIYAIQAPGLSTDNPNPASIDDAAARAHHHITKILNHHHTTTATLIGWSVGGVIAHQIAAQAPDVVDKLILLDSYPTPVWEQLPPPNDAQIYQGLAAMAGITTDDTTTPHTPEQAAELLKNSGGVFSTFPKEKITRIVELITHNATIMRQHHTAHYPGTLILCAAQHDNAAMDPTAWEPFANQVDIHRFPLTHPEMVSAAVFKEVAHLLKD